MTNFSPISYMRPGGKIIWLRVVFIILGVAAFALVLYLILKPILKGFGILSGDAGNGGGSAPTVIDTQSLLDHLKDIDVINVDMENFNPGPYVDDALAGFGWTGIYTGKRCDIIKRLNDLNDDELAIVAAAYQVKQGNSLRADLTNLWTTGWCFGHPETELEKRLQDIEQTKINF